jgi:hypothetical protein
MSIYRIEPVGGGSRFKVHVADETGGLRVVGIFFTESDARMWIATDRGQTGDTGNAPEPVAQA